MSGLGFRGVESGVVVRERVEELCTDNTRGARARVTDGPIVSACGTVLAWIGGTGGRGEERCREKEKERLSE